MGGGRRGLWTSIILAHVGHNQVIPIPAPEAPVGLMTPLDSSTAPFSLGSHSPPRSCSSENRHMSPLPSAPTNTSGDVATSPELGLGRRRPSPSRGSLCVYTSSTSPPRHLPACSPKRLLIRDGDGRSTLLSAVIVPSKYFPSDGSPLCPPKGLV